jgi:hypothetical protein
LQENFNTTDDFVDFISAEKNRFFLERNSSNPLYKNPIYIAFDLQKMDF